ncbi:hypothetical protein C8R47DRAFT_1192927 [Mycena vitilis]|nr:hypothetical protein C8R47DRAFT_1192927 [Mycena vitilis]
MSPPTRRFVFPTGLPLSKIFGQRRRLSNRYLSTMAGPKNVIELQMDKPLQEQLTSAPRDADTLSLKKDTPSDAHWDLLSNHFLSVKDLFMDSGYRERLNDGKIPLHWPLEKLTISSSCGEVCRSPWILEGRVPHLVFNYTCGLLFEGPTMAELFAAHRAAGKVEPRKPGGPITVIYGPDLVEAWLRENHADKDPKNEEEAAAAADADGPKSQLKTLEIIYNDARDTLFRYVLAHPNLIDPAETLNIDASSRNDLLLAPERILEDVFPQLVQLRTLVLALGDHYDNRAQLSDFFQYLPPNLRVLRLRSSVSLATNEDVVERWVKAFADPAFLPGLERLSFVLDLVDGEQEQRASQEWFTFVKAEQDWQRTVDQSKDEGKDEGGTGDAAEQTSQGAPVEPTIRAGPSDETLARAKRACERVHRSAESRGVQVEPFMGEWNAEFAGKMSIDERWEKM